MIFALRWLAIGFASSLIVDMLLDPPALITVFCGVLAGFVVGVITMLAGDWFEALLSRFNDDEHSRDDTK